MEKTDAIPEPSQENLKINLDNWVKERPIWLKAQRNVRNNIAKAIATDVSYPDGSFSIPKRLTDYRTHINNSLKTAIDRLSDLPVKEDGVIGEPKELSDSVTGAKFITRMRRTDSGYISEEIRPEDSSVISQANIGDNGDLRLTLDFNEPRYEERNANPGIIDSPKFSVATKVLFLNHSASLGVINWKGK